MSEASTVIPAKAEIQQNELPDNWVMTTLGKVTQPIEKVKPADEPQKEILYLDIGGIDKATNTVVDYKKYLGKDAPSRAQQAIKKGDIALANVRPYLKNIALVPNDLDDQVGSTGFCFLRPEEGVDNKYIYYWVLSNAFINDIAKYQKGSSYPAVTNKQILERNIPLAPPEQQKRIVAKIEELFSHIDAGIGALKKAKQLLKQYRQSVLKAAVTGELTKEWREANKGKLEPATQLLEHILKERRQKWEEQQLEQFKAKGKMPKDDKWKEKYKEPYRPLSKTELRFPKTWRLMSVDQVSGETLIGLVRSNAQQSIDPVGNQYLKMNNIDMDGNLRLDEIVYVYVTEEEQERYKLRKGDILFNTRNSVELVGKTAMATEKVHGFVFNNNIMRIRMIDSANPEFVAMQMCSPSFRKEMEEVKRATTSVAAVYGKDLFPLPLVFPPLVEQMEIARIVDEKMTSIAHLENELDIQLIKAEKNKQSVLASAFSGKIGMGQ